MRHSVALVAGGYTGEYEVSMRSVLTIEKHLDPAKYDVYKIIITREEWYHVKEDGSKTSVDKNDFSIVVNGKHITFDVVFIAIHGTPGEDGKLQGYLDMLGIPYTTCNQITAALTFNKNFCNRALRSYDVVNIANSVVLYKETPYSLGVILEKVKLPVFVKPNESGSSLGVSKVETLEQLVPAIEKAFTEDKQVLIEEYIKGREFSIGIYQHNGELVVLPPTEVITQNDFFDYEAKYKPGVTEEITPANITAEILDDMQKRVRAIYIALNLSGLARIDFILHEESNELYFLEINTMPGQSETSFIPQQVCATGMDLTTFYGILVDEVLNKKK